MAQDEAVARGAADGRPPREGRLVVAVALVDGTRRVLAARRTSPPSLAGKWEFPGGKVEPGESDLAALHRECREELGVEIEAGRLFGEIALPMPGWRMRLWLGRLRSGTPVATEHDELRWLAAGELDDVPWLPADVPLVNALRVELTASAAEAAAEPFREPGSTLPAGPAEPLVPAEPAGPAEVARESGVL